MIGKDDPIRFEHKKQSLMPSGEQSLTIASAQIEIKRKRSKRMEFVIFTLEHKSGHKLEHKVLISPDLDTGQISFEFIRFCKKVLRQDNLDTVTVNDLIGNTVRCEIRHRNGLAYIAKVYRHDAVIPRKKSLIITDLSS